MPRPFRFAASAVCTKSQEVKTHKCSSCKIKADTNLRASWQCWLLTPSIPAREVEAGGSLGLRPFWSTGESQGSQGYRKKSYLKNKTSKQNKRIWKHVDLSCGERQNEGFLLSVSKLSPDPDPYERAEAGVGRVSTCGWGGTYIWRVLPTEYLICAKEMTMGINAFWLMLFRN